MNIITGGSGFIGSHLAKALLKKGESVTVIDKVQPSFTHPKLSFIQANLVSDKTDDILNAFKNADNVYHCSAVCGVKNFQNGYVNSAFNLLSDVNVYAYCTSAEKPLNVVYFSTSEVYGNNKNAKETDGYAIMNNIRGQYATEKLMGEYIFKNLEALGCTLTIVRPFNIIGDGQSYENGHVLPLFIELAKENKPLVIYGDGSDTRMYCPVEDCVNAVIALTGINGTFNVGSNKRSNYLSVKKLAEMTIEALSSSSEIQYVNIETKLKHRKPDLSKMLEYYKPKRTVKQFLSSLAKK